VNYVKARGLNPSEPRYALEAAVAFHQLKDYETALDYYDERIESGNGSWSVYLNAAGCAYNLEDYARAVTYLEKVVALDSTKERALALLSDAYLNRLEDCENGVMWTSKWLALDSTNCEAYKSLGLAYLSNICSANYLKAIDYFDHALNCYQAKGMSECSSSDVMLYRAQAYHLHAAGLVENDRK
jgi:tetratricopeptide (TPR) repeat protein